MKEKDGENNLLINDVPDRSTLISQGIIEKNEKIGDGNNSNKIKKIVLISVGIFLFIALIISLLLIFILNQKEEAPSDEKIYGKIICKYLLKKNIYTLILYEGFIVPEKFDIFVDGKKINNYKNYKLNTTGEYNVTYCIKEAKFNIC